MKIESIVGETILCFEQQSAIIEKYIYIYIRLEMVVFSS